MAMKASVLLICLALGCISLVQGATQIGKDYAFSYSADGSAREESADDQGTVRGSYTYIDDNGVERTVRYLASEGTGFAAEGEGVLNVAQLIADTRARRGPYEPSPEELASWANADRSYSLSYHAGDSARSEISRPDGYVTGSYSYLDQDGNERLVEYEAGPGIGFRVKGDHIHPKIASSSVPSEFEIPNLQLTDYTRLSGQFDYEPSDIRKEFHSDGSITYSYVATDHSRSETVYPNGEVRGTYTYVADDGQTHTVEYVGASSLGFLASGTHFGSNVGRLAASDIERISRNQLTGAGLATAGGSRIQTTRTETVRGGQGASVGAGLVGLGSGGTTIETTRTETVRGSQGGSGSTGIAGLSTQLQGSGGTRVQTTRTETVESGSRGPVVLPSVVDSDDRRRVVITTTTTQDRRRGGASGLAGAGGSRFLTTTQDSRLLQNLLSGQQGNLNIVVRPSGSRLTTGTSGTRRVVTTTSEQIPGVLASFVDRGAGSTVTGGSRQQTQTIIRRPLRVTGTQVTGSNLITQRPIVRPEQPTGPHFISFSTPDGKDHRVNLG